jgi:cell division protein FtsL
MATKRLLLASYMVLWVSVIFTLYNLLQTQRQMNDLMTLIERNTKNEMNATKNFHDVINYLQKNESLSH